MWTTTDPKSINDLFTIPQDPFYYSAITDYKANDEILVRKQTFRQSILSVWDEDFEKVELKTEWDMLFKAEYFGVNYNPWPLSFTKKLQELCNTKAYPSCNIKAIVLEHSNLRALPTELPLFNDPTLPGEGFPFDMCQYSSIHSNTPVRIPTLYN